MGVNKARQSNHYPALDVPLPDGRNLDVHKSQLALEPSAVDFPNVEAIYGFVGQINDAACKDAATPLFLRIVVKLPPNTARRATNLNVDGRTQG